ncbi:uncharacterized protein LOC128557380 [Mercenaria mercenaria]|uniref:uncharacterized protein LOC128557380 n=1 Tax=Mercenaria mercenaria TaxID=6596 RepID=UPI00234EA3AD|nr:uncharacterized protein LOC128557380 [Mercenaria mercenaria]
MDYDKWVSMGDRMGFSGSELSDYVDRKEKEYTEREERMMRREDERQRRDEEKRRYDEEQRRFQAQEAEKKRLFELEQAEKLRHYEEQQAKEKRLFEIERLEKDRVLKEQELERLKRKADAGALGTDKGAEPLSSKTLRPRLPKFEESKDDMDAYLERFERFTKTQGWKEETWAVSLSSLLTGKCLDVYTRMPPDQAKKGNRYILTVVDYATRYPEAVALPRIETERVAEALLDIFSRVGFPSEILSDRGSQFTSQLMEEVCRLISLKQLFTTPYNPKCNGFCSLLKKMCQEKPKDWDRYLPAVQFAYREVPQASTGFSPFELLYGRTVRGPMQVLKKLWTEAETPETRNTYEYILDLRNRMEETCKIARESLHSAQETYKHHYDKSARNRNLKVGDKVLLLLPTNHNKLMLQWKGPYEVVDVVNKMDFKVKVGDKIGLYHINLLKKYEERQDIFAGSVAVIEADVSTDTEVVDNENLLDLVRIGGSETYENVQINPHLSESQITDIKPLIKQYQDIFTESPGTTNLVEHKVELTTTEPVRVKQYPIPYAKRNEVNQEVQHMLKAGIIEPATSAYSSPIVMVKKKDNTNRFCIDFRRLNSITKFDTEPMGNDEDIRSKLHGDKFFTKLNLSKGYWQIPVEKQSRHLTAFTTSEGSFQFRKMPFGYDNISFTGHKVGNDQLEMEDDKLERIKNAEEPKTKRQVRSFLGLTGYYRKFIASYSEVAAPLTDLIKKGKPNTVCDASDTGVGAALLQRYEDGQCPIAYASKKLLQRERNYSVIERECLSIVFGVKKFQKYLYGSAFILQTDHAPLSYIQKCKVESSRILRWALFLQCYRFKIESIKGTENVCADYLSRQ